MSPHSWLPFLLGVAVLLPLASFFLILIAGPRCGRRGVGASYIATLAIGSSAVLSFISLCWVWLPSHWPQDAAGHHEVAVASHDSVLPPDGQATEVGSDHHAPPHSAESVEAPATGVDAAASAGAGHGTAGTAGDDHDAMGQGHAAHASHEQPEPPYYAGDYWLFGQFGNLRMTIAYYIDALTVCMFCMVTFIATLIHIYASGYMQDELDDVTDHEVATSDGRHLHRPGRYHRFFQYLSLFCFSMLGLVLAGNVAMVFMFWELVGVCSYFLIGFYVERQSASNAANKAFIVNRVGDFGMIIGLMALWTGLGTFSFGEYYYRQGGEERLQPGMFQLVRTKANHRQLATPEGLVLWGARGEIQDLVSDHAGVEPTPGASNAAAQAEAVARVEDWRAGRAGYWLLIVAGVGIFCGCVGKSAQFPLHVWLPDAMEGPTPVSALVHSATMVAAGVYLVGRFYPMFAPEVLMVIAVVGVITLFIAATIAITATDIKRVLAYSTVSQLGYMMMALGVGAWLAGIMHLITHAFFKSLLFMCSGSVIHAVHTNEMPEMGGLRRKMPVTAYTMLVGCMAIAGAGVPFMMTLLGDEHLAGLGLSGFYSKDAILEQAFQFMRVNHFAFGGVFFLAAAGGAAITAFYMFRMWYLTFAGRPRNQERYDHAHESPAAMYVPLIILAVMAIVVAWKPLQAIVAGVAALAVFAVTRRMFRTTAVADHGHHTDHAMAHPSHVPHAANHGQSNHGHAGHGNGGHDHGDHGHEHGHGHGGLPGWLGDLPFAITAGMLALGVIWSFVAFGENKLGDVVLVNLLEQARPLGTLAGMDGQLLAGWTWPNEHDSHHPAIVVPVSLIAIGTAFCGFMLATAMYALGWLNPADVRRQFAPVHRFLLNKWWFDELYDFLFVRPSHVIARFISGIDKSWLDWLIDGSARLTRSFSVFWDRLADRAIVDGSVNLLAGWTYSAGLSLRAVQTGRLRQYVMFIIVGAVAIFVLISFFWSPTIASVTDPVGKH